MVYILHVIEYQFRGVPHAHIVLRLKNGIDTNDDTESLIDFVNKYFIAEMPRFAREENQNVFQDDGELQFDTMYRKKAMELVRTYNVHQCVDAINGCLKGTRCRRGYNRTAPIPETYIDDAKSRVVYRRRDFTMDLRIVPYNLPMMMDWGSHINVEYSGSSLSAVYI